MAINFPTSLDTLTNKTDNVDDVMAVDVNDLNDIAETVEAKVGIDSSEVVTSLDYKVKNVSSSNPGHKHTLADGATDVTATKDEINTACDGSTAKNSHTHGAAGIEAAAVTQAKLKTSQGSVHNSAGGNSTLPGGEYGFYPQVKVAAGSGDFNIGGGVASTSYTTNLWFSPAGDGYAQQRYVTSSGEAFWIFILRDKITKRIVSIWQAPDHPCMGNGGKPLLMPHPFGNYDAVKDEIIVINPTNEEVLEMRVKTIQPEDTPDRDLTEVIAEDYEIDEMSKPTWPTKEVTVGLPHDWDEAWQMGKLVTPIKKAIPKMGYIQCRKLKLKP